MGYTPQKFEDFKTILKAEHFKNIESAILELEQKATDSFRQVGKPIDFSTLKGKKIVCIGDSITQGVALGNPDAERPTDVNGQIYPAITDEELKASIPEGTRSGSYPYYLGQLGAGLQVDNLGTSGWCLPTGYTLQSKLNGYNQQGQPTNTTNIHNLRTKTYPTTDPYAIFIMFGVNEFTRHYPLGRESELYANHVEDKLSSYALTYIRYKRADGTNAQCYVDGDENIVATYDSATDTYNGITESCIDDTNKKIYVLTDNIYGAWEYTALRLKKDFTKSKIVFMTPYLFRGIYNVGGHPNYIATPNKAGYYFSDMMDVIISTGLKYKIPVLDNFYHGGVNLDNAYKYMGDGCHLSYYGGISIAKNMLEFLLLDPIVLDPKWLAPGGTVEFAASTDVADDGMIHVTGIALDKTELRLDIGDTYRLTPSITPQNASDRKVTWMSSDEKIATVSTTGLVTAVASGTAVISCLTSDSGMNSTCDVSVN